MLNTKEITKIYKGTKIISRADLYKAKKKKKKKKTGQKAVNWHGSSVAKIRNLRNLQVAKFRNTAKFHSFFLLFCIFSPNVFQNDHSSSSLARVHRV